ncbi:TPA: HlyC/CorC family transporter [Candidatus Woesearchaeota archaeon]|nr:HlyC/CorC family transporter [Candidatus Woesearchaeota archaeon]HIH31358.1 HlyC/CorC family transporter [Candidatus Woesearchaeota archaeon]HIH54581.1 HlyC/CorC family transporter [Candidatus Woesearchaeota archaeon]HIJ02365.1 HlyC/CorC family transporter [Candidatus Woesearchaeota archaeon]HIJ14157.1 HlyC/CorC family transporter [Candidatus Woesearchaeota archaeon]
MYEAIILIVLIMFSAFFSGYESAILSLRISRIRELVKKKVRNARLVEKFKQDQHKTIITLLVGNNIVNITASALATKMTFDFLAKYNIQAALGIAIATGIMTFLLLIFGEITPKTLAMKKAEQFALFGAGIFKLISIILTPFRMLFEAIASLILGIFGISLKESSYYTAGELKEFVEMSHEEGAIKESEKEMIHNVLDFNVVNVKEIMTPLSKVVAVDADETIKDIIVLLVKDNFSRIPVYNNHIEDMIGVIFIKDLLPYIERQETNIKLRDIMRKIVHIPSSKKINTLFHYFKNKKEHIAVVVNEYGNTLGIVTMEDVLEELVGEIQDESDDADENNIKKIDENTILVPGSTNIDDINELLHMSIDDHEGSFQTVAGMIMYYSGKIPKKGHVLKINSLTFTIIDSDHKKIEKVKIEKISSSFKKDLIHSTHKIFK